MWITKTSIQNPVFATMVMVALMVLGLFSYRGLGLEAMPNVDIPGAMIEVKYPGASPEAVENDSTTQGDVQDLNTAYNEDDGKLGYYGHVSIAKGNWNEDAGKLADEIEQAFRTATAHSSPVWASGQTAGILEPIRFRTRQPGDREFYRTYADEGEPGQDLAVTLMLDVSGSMSGTGPALGAAAYAVKRAGDALSIDTEVAVFESNPHLIWAADDRPDCVPEIGATGSTYPAELFQALLTERRDKAKHIVIIMTDGGWGGSGQPDVDLRTYAEDNRFIVLLGYGLSKAVENLMERGPDEAYHITDLFEIPALLENILVAMENSFSEQLLAEAEGQRIAGSSADAMEGGLAFLEKRKPNFQGK